MLANNEIGVVQPIVDAIGAAIKAKNPKTLFHTDAVQGAGKIPFDVEKREGRPGRASPRTRCTAPRASARCGCAASRACASIRCIDGGGHERGMRSGTLNVPLIVGFGKAAELAKAEMADEAIRLERAARPAATAASRRS